MNRRQWIGFIIFPAAIAAILAFLFFVAEVDAFRQRTVSEAMQDLKSAGDPDIRMKGAQRFKQLAADEELDAEGRGQAVEALQAALEDASPSVRFSAADALIAVQGAAASGTLAPLVKDEDPDVRRITVFLLGQLRSEANRPVFQNALKDASEPVRWNAAVALALLKDASGREVLHDMLRAPAPRSLGKAFGNVVPTGEAPRPEPDRHVHANAMLALDLVGDATSVQSLERFVEAEVNPDLDTLAKATIADIKLRLGKVD